MTKTNCPFCGGVPCMCGESKVEVKDKEGEGIDA